MADDITLNAGTGGDTVAADDIGGIKFQRVKIALGANNTNDGDVASGNPMPVTGTVAVTNAGITTIAGAVAGSEMQVDVVTSALPSGAATSAKQDTGNTSLSSIDGKITAVNTGAVVVSSSALPSGAATAAKQPALGTAGTPSVDVITVQGDVSMTPIQVADNGGSLTVDGTVAVTNAGITTIAGAVSGSEMQVDVVAALPAGTNNIGDVDVLTVPADPFGANADAAVAAGAAGSIQAKLRRATQGLEDLKTLIVLAAGTNAIGKLAANSGVDIGDVDVTSIAAGANLIGDVGIQPRATNGVDTMNATSSDGATALTSTAQVIKASAGKLFGYYIYNPNATAQFVQFYNTAAGSVTVGTTNPLFMLTIPATSGANLMGDIGITFGTAMSWAATSTAGGSGAPSTALDAVAWFK